MGDVRLQLEEDETSPGPCACGACRQRALLEELVAKTGITRLTSIRAVHATEDPWTVYVVQDGHVVASGRGVTEELALHEALRTLGVVT